MTEILILLYKLQCSNCSSNLISGFAKNADLSNGVFLNMKRECSLVQRKRNKMVTSAIPPSLAMQANCTARNEPILAYKSLVFWYLSRFGHGAH